MRSVRWLFAHLEGWRADLAMKVFGQSSSWGYCHRCWRRGDWNRPLHKAVDRHPNCYRAWFCEPCTTILGMREWPCDNCGLSRDDFDRYILSREGLVSA